MKATNQSLVLLLAWTPCLLLGGCVTSNDQVTELHREQELHDANPALYELERTRQANPATSKIESDTSRRH